MTTAIGKRGKDLCNKNAYRGTQTKRCCIRAVQLQKKSEKIHSGYEWGKKAVDKKQHVLHLKKERGEDLSL